MTKPENAICMAPNQVRVFHILNAPALFFSGLTDKRVFLKAFLFAVFAGTFHAILSLFLLKPTHPYMMGGILLTNAVGMILIGAALSQGIIALVLKTKVPFTRLFSVFAFSSGITLFISWMPPFTFFSEIWKWGLVFVGLKSSCSLTGKSAFFVILLSIILQYVLFLSLVKAVFS